MTPPARLCRKAQLQRVGHQIRQAAADSGAGTALHPDRLLSGARLCCVVTMPLRLRKLLIFVIQVAAQASIFVRMANLAPSSTQICHSGWSQVRSPVRSAQYQPNPQPDSDCQPNPERTAPAAAASRHGRRRPQGRDEHAWGDRPRGRRSRVLVRPQAAADAAAPLPAAAAPAAHPGLCAALRSLST